MKSQAFSYTRPVATNDTAEGRAENRRIEVFLTEDETPVMGDAAVDKVVVTETQSQLFIARRKNARYTCNARFFMSVSKIIACICSFCCAF